MPLSLTELEPAKREVVRELLGGASPEDVAWALAQPPERVVELAHEALTELDPDLAREVDDRDRARVADYLLRQQPPGQAAGTWDLLDRSPEGRRWALWIRECLSELYGDEPPAIPKVDDDAEPPSQRQRGRSRTPERGLRARRKARKRKREIRELQAAAAELQTPFRREALEAYREGSESLKLPHFASRPTRYTLYGLLVVLLAGLVLAVVVRVPTFTQGTVLVASVPDGAGGPVDGLGTIGLFPPEQSADLEPGQSLSVQLPNTSERTTSEIRYVSARPLSPHEIVERFQLPEAQANQVIGPAVVAVADLTTPPKAPRRERFDGSVSPEADARTGSRRVISMVVP